MKAKAEELLYLLLWTGDVLANPTFRNLTDSFEAWAYRKGLLRELQRLEKKQLLEHRANASSERLHRLTQQGLWHVMGRRDPVGCWNGLWDGKWRLVLFDVPETSSVLRDRLRRYLQNRGFGYLQHSAWISPHSLKEEQDLLADAPPEVGAVLLLEARPWGVKSDAAIVASAWDFSAINAGYATYEGVLKRFPGRSLNSATAAAALQRWISQERRAWLQAISRDPLLPACLLPKDYAGRRVWARRLQIMASAGHEMRRFSDHQHARQ